MRWKRCGARSWTRWLPADRERPVRRVPPAPRGGLPPRARLRPRGPASACWPTATAAALTPAGAYSSAGVGPNRPSVGAPAAAARCIRPESLPTNSAHRARQAATSGRLSRPTRSIASGRAASSSSAIARSVSPGPANTTGTAPGSGPRCRRMEQRGKALGGPDLWRPVRRGTEPDDRPARGQQRGGAGTVLGCGPGDRQAAADRDRVPRQAARSCDRAAVASPRGDASAPSRRSSIRGCPRRGPTACRPWRPIEAASAGGRVACRARWYARGSACARTRPRRPGRRRR